MMEFFIHNKDDNKLTTLVNLATQFKIGEDNFIVYYNTQVEKTSIDIYIGQLSYGNQNLIITKIVPEKQNEFLQIIKDILAGKNPETEKSDYANIIDTATIVLDSVQKIQIPTKSLDLLLNYPSPSLENKTEETTNNEEQNIENKSEDTLENKTEETTNVEETPQESNVETTKQETNVEETTTNSPIDTDLSGLDTLLRENEDTKKKAKEKLDNKSKKAINTPLLVVLILTIIAGIIYFVTQYVEF